MIEAVVSPDLTCHPWSQDPSLCTTALIFDNLSLAPESLRGRISTALLDSGPSWAQLHCNRRGVYDAPTYFLERTSVHSSNKAILGSFFMALLLRLILHGHAATTRR